MFTELMQSTYKDGNGNEVQAATIDVLGPYKYMSDGFHHWECGACQHKSFDRSCGWPIAGQVLKCAACGKHNLLVKTNCVEIDEALTGFWKQPEVVKELEALREIRRLNHADIETVRRQVWSEIGVAMERAITKAKEQP